MFTVSWISLAVDDNKHHLHLRESLLGLAHVTLELSRFDVLDKECTAKDHSYKKIQKKEPLEHGKTLEGNIIELPISWPARVRAEMKVLMPWSLS